MAFFAVALRHRHRRPAAFRRRRRRRRCADARVAVDAAAQALDDAFDRRGGELPEPEAVTAQIGAVRRELYAPAPHPLLLPAYLEELAYEVKAVDELSGAVADLRARVDTWLA